MSIEAPGPTPGKSSSHTSTWLVMRDERDGFFNLVRELEAECAFYSEALRQIAESHDRLDRDPPQHCTDLARIARMALGWDYDG